MLDLRQLRVRRLVFDDDGDVLHRVAELAAGIVCERLVDELPELVAVIVAVAAAFCVRFGGLGARASRKYAQSRRDDWQRSQSGFGRQTRRPCRISASDARVQRSGGRLRAERRLDDLRIVRVARGRCRFATRSTWRSTGSPGTPSA